MKGWFGSEVLYFGDHVYSDLAVSDVDVIFAPAICPVALAFKD